ncbi:MAG: N-acetylmuramoyl-L-alanine amidase [Lachnospiraceae bacterium]|nr:N-acetylmuramoyl-L-alanine amidase [Lachnospiraceae bacterium]
MIFRLILLSFLLFFLSGNLIIPSFAAPKPPKRIQIVIDPGHGGENPGAKYNHVIEKELTLRVAYAMKKELELYDNVDVYLTREKDESLELVERAQFAKMKNADILLSLHFNMSETHENYGAEMWISSQGALKAEATSFSIVENLLLKDLGLTKTMINTRLNELGTDYYGVIRESALYQIPAVIIEHCYLDCKEEYSFYDNANALEILGKLDATAVAMNYRLSSEKLGVDYKRIKTRDIALPQRVLALDSTGPLSVNCTIKGFDEKKEKLIATVKVNEPESQIVSYEYSLNGGQSYSDPIDFWGIDGEMDILLPLVNSKDVIIRVCNSNSLHHISEEIDLTPYYEQYHISNFIQEDPVMQELKEEQELYQFENLFSGSVDEKIHRLVLIIGGLTGGISALFYFFLERFKRLSGN